MSLSKLLLDEKQQKKKGQKLARYARIAGFVLLVFICFFVLSYLFSFLRYILGAAVLLGAGYGAWVLSKPWRSAHKVDEEMQTAATPEKAGEKMGKSAKQSGQAADELYAKYVADEQGNAVHPESKPAAKQTSVTPQDRQQHAREQLEALKRQRTKS